MSENLTKEQLIEYLKKQRVKIKKLETEVASLKEKAEAVPPAPVEDAKASSSAPAEEIQRLLTDKALLEDQLNEKTTEVFRQSKLLESLEEAVKNCDGIAQDEIAKIAEEKATLEISVKQLTNDLAKSELRATSAEQKVADMFANSSDLANKLEQSNKENASLKENVSNLSSELSQLRDKSLTDGAQLSELQKQLDNSISLVRELELKNEAVIERARKLEAECNDRTTSAELSMSTLQGEFDALQGKWRESLEALNQAQQELKNAQNQQASGASAAESSLSEEISRLKAELLKSEEERKELNEHLKKTEQESECSRADTIAAVEAMQAQIMEFHTKASAERSASAVVVQNLENQLLAHSDCGERETKAAATIAELNIQASESQRVMDSLIKQVQELQKEVTAHKAIAEAVSNSSSNSSSCSGSAASQQQTGGGKGKKKGKKAGNTDATAHKLAQQQTERIIGNSPTLHNFSEDVTHRDSQSPSPMLSEEVEDKDQQDDTGNKKGNSREGEEELKQLREQLAELQNNNAVLTVKIKDISAEREQAKRAAAADDDDDGATGSASAMAALQAQLSETEAKVSALEAELAAESDKSKARIEKAIAKNKELRAAMEKKETDLEVSETKLKELQAQLTEAQKGGDSASAAMADSLLCKEKEIESLQLRLDTIVSEQSETLNKVTTASQAALEEVQLKYDKVNSECEELVKALKISEENCTMCLSRAETLSDAQEQALTEAKAASTEKEKQIESLQQQITDLGRNSDAASAELSSTLLDKEKQIESLQQQIADLGRNSDAASAELAAMTVKHGEQTESQFQQIKQLTKDLEAAHASIAEAHDSGSSAEATLSQNLQEAKTETDKLKTELSVLQQQLKASEAESVLLKEQAAKLSADVEASSGSAAELAKQSEALMAAEAKNKKLVVRLKALMKEQAESQAAIEAAAASASSSVSKEVAALKEKLSEAELALAQWKKNYSDLSQELQSKSISHEALLAAVVSDKKALQEQVYESVREHSSLKQERDEAVRRVSELNAKSEAIESRACMLSHRIDELQQQLTLRTKDSESALGSERSRLREAEEAMKRSQTELNQLLAAHEKYKAQMKQEQAEATSKSEATNEKMKKLKLLLNKMNKASEEKDARLAQFVHQNERPKRFFIAARLSLSVAAPVFAAPPTDSQKNITASASGDNLEENDEEDSLSAITTSPSHPVRLAPRPPVRSDWCCVLDCQSLSGGDNVDNVVLPRWVEQKTVHKWVGEGSELVADDGEGDGSAVTLEKLLEEEEEAVAHSSSGGGRVGGRGRGGDGWPEPLQHAWYRLLNAERTRLNMERDDALAELEEVNNTFAAYKLRAQTALKRIGTEDRTERQRAQEQEQALVQKLKDEIAELNEKGEDLADQLDDALDSATRSNEKINICTAELVELRTQVSSLEKSLSESKDTVGQLEEKLQTSQGELQRVTTELATVQKQADALLQEKHLQQVMGELPPLQKASKPIVDCRDAFTNTEEEVAFLPNSSSQNSTSITHEEHLVGNNGGNAPGSAVTKEQQEQQAANSDGRLQQQQPQNEEDEMLSALAAGSSKVSLPFEAQNQTSVYSQQQQYQQQYQQQVHSAPLLLHQQAESVLKDAVATLRRENAGLTMEILELKGDLGLREDQVEMLKSTIRDIESALAREQEFNAGNRRINADYLVNVLRNFLMSKTSSERAKLVPVLCTILQFRADESKVIVERWADKPSGGLVGWFMPPKVETLPQSTAPSENRVVSIHNPKEPRPSDTIADSYDPATGSGLNFDTYG